MAPVVILIGFLLATMSCLTTALNITTANPTGNHPINSTANPTGNHPINSTANSTGNHPINITANRPTNSTANTPINPNSTANTPINPNSTANTPINPNSTANTPINPNSTANTPINPNSTANTPIISTANTPINPNSTANPQFNSTANTPTNITANTPINPNSTANPQFNSTADPPKGSCANPDLCCSGLNSSCHRLNCFCDVACLRIGDCCPDFKPTCLTVHNSSNGTKPNNTLTLTGTCSKPTLCCSGLNYTCFSGCFCDEVCKQLNDCCPDLNSTCTFNTTTAAPPLDPTADPPFFTPINPPFFTTTASPEDVLSILANLDVEVLAEESSTEEERQAALRQVAALLESYLRAYNNDIYSFEVTRIEPVSSSSSSLPCD